MNEGIVRRKFLQVMASGACLSLLPRFPSRQLAETRKADLILRISPVQIEIAPGRIIKTNGYNGSVPGPFLRFREGQRVAVDVLNDTKDAEVVHWHGLFLPAEVDGSMEEGTPPIAAHSQQRYSFLARPQRHALVPHPRARRP
jgi:FtsP/CotA-like multicopper oxidase with cupredoxin domain